MGGGLYSSLQWQISWHESCFLSRMIRSNTFSLLIFSKCYLINSVGRILKVVINVFYLFWGTVRIAGITPGKHHGKFRHMLEEVNGSNLWINSVCQGKKQNGPG
jgi:hypothetical protein